MTTLAVDTPRTYELGDLNDLPVIASDIIYEGAAVGENGSGYSRPLVAGDPFQGFAVRKADNSDGSAGDINVKVKARGYIRLTVAGATAITANDHPSVYASDDGTFTLTASTNTLIGNVYRWLASTDCIVYFDTPRPPSTVGTADIEADAIDGTLIADDAIDSEHYTDGSIDTAHIAADAIDGTLIADDAIDSEHYTDGSIDTAHIAADAIDGTLIADDAVSLEHLDSALTPSHIVKYAGEVTWSGGGATLAHTVTGALATDLVEATFHTLGSEGTIIQGAVASSDTVTLTLDTANTSNDAVITYVVYRAAA